MLNPPLPENLEQLSTLLGPKGLIAGDGEAAAPYLVEPRDRWQGIAGAIARPSTTAEVAEILKICSAHRIGVVPISGGTGLVGGQTKPDGPAPLLLSLERMNKIRAVLPDDGAIIAEAGCVLADIKQAADEAGRLFPLSLASEGTCRIGGNLATNAGGVQVLRYGNARDLVLDVEAVLADGTVIEGTRTLRKNNMGFDLRHLLIGSEGSLAVITAASLKLFPKPGEVVTGMLAVPGPAEAVRLLHALKDRLGDEITGFELIHSCGLDFIKRFHSDFTDPLDGDPTWRVLFEIIGPVGSGLNDLVEEAMADLFETGLATDGVIAQSEAQREALWWVRETIPESNRKVGAVASTDISMPMSKLAEFIAAGGEVIKGIDPNLIINCFGHVGDGNLHYNVFPAEGRTRPEYDNVRPVVKREVHDLVHSMGGSVSAEHGVGRLKLDDLAKYGDPGLLTAMRAIKQALDPLGILNPGAVVPL
ncbi:FAD-binding oxidoreductase [Rhodobacteraceae bacterium NNCM2]|nr:FAD-binding oxidoreductase [Coraliihabitans acroporae]